MSGRQVTGWQNWYPGSQRDAGPPRRCVGAGDKDQASLWEGEGGELRAENKPGVGRVLEDRLQLEQTRRVAFTGV